MKLDQDQIKQYSEFGFLKVDNVVTEDSMNNLIKVINEEVDKRTLRLYASGLIKETAKNESFARRWYEVSRQISDPQDTGTGWHGCMFSKELYDMWTHPAILDVVGSVIGNEIQCNGDYWVRPKLPGEIRTALPWHQDSAYMPGSGEQHWPTVWLPLVPVDSVNGTLQFISGSHQLSVQDHGAESASKFKTPAVDPSAGKEVVTLDMNPGDLVIFHNRVFHRSTVNGSSAIRWSADFRYSPKGDPITGLWHEKMCFTARSIEFPGHVSTWESVKEKWQNSDQKERA